VQIVVPALPGKAIKLQLPFRNDDGIFDEQFIEDRRKGLEAFVNKYVSHLFLCFTYSQRLWGCV
jgi:sorting nexin-3/12